MRLAPRVAHLARAAFVGSVCLVQGCSSSGSESAPAESAASGPEPRPSAAGAAATTPAWQTLVERHIADSEYAVRADGDRFCASTRAHALLARCDARGVALRARDGAGKPLRIGLAGAGSAFTLGACRVDGAVDTEGACLRRIERAHGALTEFWEN